MVTLANSVFVNRHIQVIWPIKQRKNKTLEKKELIFKFYKPNFVGKDTLIYLKCSENEKYFIEIRGKIFAQTLGAIWGIFDPNKATKKRYIWRIALFSN